MARQVAKGKISEAEKAEALRRIRTGLEMSVFDDCDMVIEAATEKEAVKREIFARLVPFLKADALIASNTSSISITALGAAARRPGTTVGIHFMNPPPVMRLVEVVRGRETSDETLTLAVELVRQLGKTPVVARDVPGFLVNRMLMPMINEALFALEAGVGSAEDIDLAMTAGTNHPVGPLALADRIGLDTVLAICEVLQRDLKDEKFRPCPLLRRYVEAGRLGRKTGRGIYDYDTTVAHAGG
jgi:3-hydroxybutyryl-CoA dehydrogenase